MEANEIIKQEIKTLITFNLLHQAIQNELARFTVIQTRILN